VDSPSVGASSGQITRPFAERRFAITTMDRGARLAALTAKNLATFPRVRVEA